jgi:hypothetical protein
MGGAPRQALRCSGHRSDGRPCRAFAINGGTVCVAHGGRAPQVQAKAARNVAERKAAKALEGITDFEAITDPIARLQLLAGRTERLMEIVGDRVEELRHMRYAGKAGEQLRAEIGVYERMLAQTGRTLVDLARLGLDSRKAELDEELVRLVNAVIRGVLAELLSPAQLASPEIRAVVARHLRLAGAEPLLAALPPAGA